MESLDGRLQEKPVNALAEQPGLQDLLRMLMQLISGISNLALVESKLAVESVPRYLELAFLKLFMVICIWLSISGCVMWLVVLASNSVMTGLIAMTTIQIMGYLVCKKMQDYHRERMTLPNTRQQLSELGEIINESIKAATESIKAATHTGPTN